MAFELTKEQQAELRTLTGRENAVFHDVREDCFDLYGLFEPRSGGRFCRIPEEVAQATSENVERLNYETAGGRVRFTTDAEYVAIVCKTSRMNKSANMTRILACGFDLYIDDKKIGGRTPHSYFVNPMAPPYTINGEYHGRIRLPEGEHSVTLYLPMYNSIDELYLGFPEGATLKAGLPYENKKPILFYGSSITQGASASRPGLAYTSMVTRRLNADHRNLGFAGSAKAEDAIVEYLAKQEMCLFVQDYDHNAPNVEHLARTHYKLYKAVRDAQPELPILLLSRPGFNTYNNKGILRSDDSIARRDVVIDTYRRARADGDKRIWFIDGEGFFSGPDETDCTIDGIHPNDIGMLKMADSVHRVMLRILNDVPFLKD